jgi:rubredoxin
MSPRFYPILRAQMSETPEYQTWMCLLCGWIYDEALGAPDDGIPPGTRWEDVPVNWSCPECGARKDDFEMMSL